MADQRDPGDETHEEKLQDENWVRRIWELEQELVRVAELMNQSEDDRSKATLALEHEQIVTKALEARLGEVSTRRLALQVFHGDVAPDQFEARRRIEVDGVRSFVASVRSSIKALPRG